MKILEGGKLVPVEPTDDMMFRAEMQQPRNYRDLYKAMLDAAPTPPVQQDEALEVLRELVEARDEFTGSRGPQAIRSAGQRIRAAEMAARALIAKRGEK